VVALLASRSTSRSRPSSACESADCRRR
jgi:hypothetical protein